MIHTEQKEIAPLEVPRAQAEEEEVDIDLTDHDVEKAAVKIQAGFRGMKTRSEMKSKDVVS